MARFTFWKTLVVLGMLIPIAVFAASLFGGLGIVYAIAFTILATIPFIIAIQKIGNKLHHDLYTNELKITKEEMFFKHHLVETINVQHSSANLFENLLTLIQSFERVKSVAHNPDTGTIQALTSASFESCGERLLVIVSPLSDNTSRIVFSSKPRLSVFPYDWGMNHRHVRRIKEFLNERKIEILDATQENAVHLSDDQFDNA